jgi:glycosyltransferase involved in cell wall biosynthesis
MEGEGRTAVLTAPGVRRDGGHRIALVSGVCVRHDAISNSLRSQADVLRSAGHEVRIFVQATDCLDPADVRVVGSSWELASDPFYASADLVVVHYGVRHDLFSALVLPHPGRRVVHFHNITPPDVLAGAARALAHDSFQLLGAAALADEVWVDSPHNAVVLMATTDVAPDRIRPMELHVPFVDRPPASPDLDVDPDRPLEVVTVGRFVPAKGLHDLLAAAGRIRARPVRLVLAGSTRYSDRSYLEQLRTRATELPDGVEAVLLADVDDDELARRLDAADVFVSASHHEGFCVPVVEALAHGCRLVVTDAGALPDTAGGCGTVVPVGDVDALAAGMDRELAAARRERRGAPTAEDRERRERVARHLRTFGSEAFRDRLLSAVDALVGAG